MKTDKKKTTQPLAKGQLWKMQTGYILIADLGKRLISYKVLKQEGQRAVRTQMAGIDSLENYLKDNGAQLVR